MFQFSERAFRKIILALALYLASLFAANTLGLKIMPFLFGAHLSVAVFSFPVVFLMTDVIGEVYGKKLAKFFVLAGFVATLAFVLYSFISLAAPWSPDGAWAKSSYDQIFGISVRIAIASVIAFIVGEYQDVIAFFFAREKLGMGPFWLRSTVSNIWSQFLDSVLFMTIAFYGIYPNATLISIIISWWLFKVGMGILYTPLSYAGIWLLKDHEHTADTH